MTETKLPKQLQRDEFRFILLKENSKNPIEEDWQNTRNYAYNDEKLLQHLEKGGNYGVLAGKGNLRVLDIDEKVLSNKYKEELKTYTIETCGKTNHFYFISEYEDNIVFEKGELRSKNMFVVGPGCYAIDKKKGHEGKYIETNALEIQNISKEEILKLIPSGSTLTHVTDENVFEDINIQEVVDKTYIEKNIIPQLGTLTKRLITEKMTEEEMKKIGYPSRSERDSKVVTTLLLNGFGNYIKSIFTHFPVGDKFREHNDGDKYLLHTIKSGRMYSGVVDDQIIVLEKELETVNERVLRNKIDDYLIRIAKIKSEITQLYLLGLIAMIIHISKKDLLKRLKDLKDINEEKNPQCLFDLITKPIEETKYFIHPIIPKNKLILFGGKPGAFKSMFILFAALSMRTGNFMFNKFISNETPSILLYDLENGENILLWRAKYLINGMNLSPKDLKNFHIEYNFNKINIKKELELSTKYDVIILDSYRRFLEGTENDSEITDKFFRDFLQPLLKMGKTVIILHHFRKGNLTELSDDDLMDIFRGSSDIPAQFDLIYGINRGEEVETINEKHTTFDVSIIKVKNRLGLPIRDFSFTVEKDDENLKTNFKFLDTKRAPSLKEKVTKGLIETLRNRGMVQRKELVKEIVLLSGGSHKSDAPDELLKKLTSKGIISQPKYGFYCLPEYLENIEMEKHRENEQQLLG